MSAVTSAPASSSVFAQPKWPVSAANISNESDDESDGEFHKVPNRGNDDDQPVQMSALYMDAEGTRRIGAAGVRDNELDEHGDTIWNLPAELMLDPADYATSVLQGVVVGLLECVHLVGGEGGHGAFQSPDPLWREHRLYSDKPLLHGG